MEKSSKSIYDTNLRKAKMKNKEKAQFNTDLNYNEKQELDTVLKEKGITKAEFVRLAKKMLEKGELDMEIKNMEILERKAAMLLNHNVDNKFYDYYFLNGSDWILENEERINKDYNNNVYLMKFDIILNSDFEERKKLIESLKNVEIDEFSNYLDYIPYEIQTKECQMEIQEKFNTFKNINDTNELIKYFDSICRSKER